MGKKKGYRQDTKEFKSRRAKGQRIARSKKNNKASFEGPRPVGEYKRPAAKRDAFQEVIRAIES